MEIKILNRSYEVTDLEGDDLKDYMGLFVTVAEHDHIRLHPGIEGKNRFYGVLLHEIVHAISHHFGIFEGDEEEKQVRQMTAGLIDVITRNRDVFEDIIKSL